MHFHRRSFRDPDCPPHFYAHGNNPQYRHFGRLMRYTNRVCSLISDGKHIALAAILYHAEADWCGECMPVQEPGMRLAESQIDYDFLPADVFSEMERYHTMLSDALYVNGMEYRCLFVNEGSTSYTGSITVPQKGLCYAYNAWDNCLEKVCAEETSGGTQIKVTLEPLKSLLILFDTPTQRVKTPINLSSNKQAISKGWKRSICRSIEYPLFEQEKTINLPDFLAEELPLFSGFVRYEKEIDYTGGKVLLEISDAAEGIEVFMNGVSAGIQIAPFCRYDLTALMKKGKNQIRIEAATTL